MFIPLGTNWCFQRISFDELCNEDYSDNSEEKYSFLNLLTSSIACKLFLFVLKFEILQTDSNKIIGYVLSAVILRMTDSLIIPWAGKSSGYRTAKLERDCSRNFVIIALRNNPSNFFVILSKKIDYERGIKKRDFRVLISVHQATPTSNRKLFTISHYHAKKSVVFGYISKKCTE